MSFPWFELHSVHRGTLYVEGHQSSQFASYSLLFGDHRANNSPRWSPDGVTMATTSEASATAAAWNTVSCQLATLWRIGRFIVAVRIVLNITKRDKIRFHQIQTAAATTRSLFIVATRSSIALMMWISVFRRIETRRWKEQMRDLLSGLLVLLCIGPIPSATGECDWIFTWPHSILYFSLKN